MIEKEQDKNYQYFLSNKNRLIAEGKEGKFALISKESIVDVFTSEKEAYDEAVKKLGQEAFLIQSIQEDETTESIHNLSHVLL